MTNISEDKHKKVIWIDEDRLFLEPYKEFLEMNGFEVEFCTSLTKGEELIKSNIYDLVILDAMIPPTEEEELGPYNTNATDLGKQAGLVFFTRIKSLLHQNKTPILVLTQRLDKEIRSKFFAEGLPTGSFARKIDLPEVRHVLEKLNALLTDQDN